MAGLIAKKIGIDEQILDDIKHCRSPKFGKDIDGLQQDLSYRLTTEYLDTSRVSDKVYAEALEVIGSEKGLIELVLVMGHYIGLAAQLNILSVPNPGDKQIFEN